MKAREVSVGIQDLGGELLVVARFKVRSAPLEREAACPDPPKCDSNKYGTRVKENARRQKEKEFQKILESVEFPGQYLLLIEEDDEELDDDDIISIEEIPDQIPVTWEDA